VHDRFLLSDNFEDVVGKEKVIIGSVGANTEDFLEALDLLPNIDTKPFTQVVMPLKDFDKAWKAQKSSTYVKVLLQP